MGASSRDEQRRGYRDPGVVLLGGLAVFLAGTYLAYLLVVSFPGADLAVWKRALTAAFGVTLPVGLLAGARWLARERVDHAFVWRVAMWSLGGLAALTLLTAWKFYVDSLGNGLGTEPFETLLLNAQAGAVAGLLVGIHDSRARESAAAAGTARDQYRLLNQLLRHNILNSVQLVDTYVDAYRVGGTDEASMLETVENQCGAIEDLVEKARTLERSTVDGDPLETVDLASAVRRQVSVFSSSYEDATFETDLPDGAPVRADPLIDALIENLLSNAVEHNDREEPTVTVSIEEGDDWTRLVVADDGPGISDRMKETVFEYEASGTPHGLGLYLVDTLASHYGGEVWAEDNDPRGTRFVVRFHRTDERAGAPSEAPDDRRTADGGEPA